MGPLHESPESRYERQQESLQQIEDHEQRRYRFDEPHISDADVAALAAYRWQGRDPGNFLRAVLCNDLAATLRQADARSFSALGNIVDHVWDCLPAQCWGDEAKVRNWMRNFNGLDNPLPF